MTDHKINGMTVTIYDSIEDLPIARFHKYNKFLLMDAGMGSDLNDIDGKIARAQAFVNKGMKSEAVLEMHNLRNTIYLIASGINLKHMALASLIHSINGKEIKDLSDENLKNVLERLNDVKVSTFDRLFQSVKKKISTEMSVYYPSATSNPGALSSFADMLRVARLQLDYILEGRDTESEVTDISESSLTKLRPGTFLSPDSEEVKHDKKFDELCMHISNKCNVDAKKMTVTEFYNAVDFIKTK